MLAERRIQPTIPAADLARARRWYEQKLGLKVATEGPGGLIFSMGGGTSFTLYPTANAGKAPNTLMAIETADLDADVKAMRGRGVVFEEYDMPGLETVAGVATMGSSRGAWFKDSEGNILALFQM